MWSASLTGPRVTDAQLVNLRWLTNLERLYLTKTAVSDTGLQHLRELTNLRWLGLQSMRITGAGPG